MTRRSKREVERLLDDLEERGLGTPSEAIGDGVSDELVSAIEAAAEYRLANPEDPIPEEIAADLSPEDLAAFRTAFQSGAGPT